MIPVTYKYINFEVAEPNQKSAAAISLYQALMKDFKFYELDEDRVEARQIDVNKIYKNIKVYAKEVFAAIKESAIKGNTQLDLAYPAQYTQEEFFSCSGYFTNTFQFFKTYFENKYNVTFSNIETYKVDYSWIRANVEDCKSCTVNWKKNNPKIYCSFKMHEPKNEDINMLEAARTLSKIEDFADVTIHLQDEEYKTSKVFLALVSPYFKTMFQASMKEKITNTYSLPWLSKKGFESFLDFRCSSEPKMYIRDLTSLDQIIELLDLCESFQCFYQKKHIESFLVNYLDVCTTQDEIFEKFIALAEKYNLEKLKESCDLLSQFSETEGQEPPQKKVCTEKNLT